MLQSTICTVTTAVQLYCVLYCARKKYTTSTLRARNNTEYGIYQICYLLQPQPQIVRLLTASTDDSLQLTVYSNTVHLACRKISSRHVKSVYIIKHLLHLTVRSQLTAHSSSPTSNQPCVRALVSALW